LPAGEKGGHFAPQNDAKRRGGRVKPGGGDLGSPPWDGGIPLAARFLLFFFLLLRLVLGFVFFVFFLVWEGKGMESSARRGIPRYKGAGTGKNQPWLPGRGAGAVWRLEGRTRTFFPANKGGRFLPLGGFALEKSLHRNFSVNGGG